MFIQALQSSTKRRCDFSYANRRTPVLVYTRLKVCNRKWAKQDPHREKERTREGEREIKKGNNPQLLVYTLYTYGTSVGFRRNGLTESTMTLFFFLLVFFRGFSTSCGENHLPTTSHRSFDGCLKVFLSYFFQVGFFFFFFFFFSSYRPI